jgi:hypothetical protein
LNFQLKDLVHRDEIVPTLAPILEQFKEDRTPGESFGDFCQRMGLTKLQTMLLPAAEGYAVDAAPAEPAPIPAAAVNGSAGDTRSAPSPEPKPALAAPKTQLVEVKLPPPSVAATPSAVPAPASPSPESKPQAPAAPPAKRFETFLAGPAGEERADFSFRYNSDGSVRETVVYFYGDDLRAAQASGFDPLRREAVYQGRVDAGRLFAARKLSDTFYVGDIGHERRDLRREYEADGRVARTVVFFYEGDRRATDSPSGTAVRRQVTLEGAA